LTPCLTSIRRQRLPTKSGATPDLTGVTPVPPNLKTRPDESWLAFPHEQGGWQHQGFRPLPPRA
jgi:hypothetical protein